MEVTFNAVTEGPHGPTIYLPKDKVKLRASQATNYITVSLNRGYVMTIHADDSITVKGDGLEPCTYAEYPED